MNHSFVVGNVIDKKLCQKCSRSVQDHSILAECESCGAIGKCDLIDNILLCEDSCFPKHFNAAKEVVSEVRDTVQSLEASAKEIDRNIRYNGDVFNAKTIANIKVRDAIFAQENVTEEDKNYQYQKFLAERVAHFREVVFKLDNEKYDAVLEMNVALGNLREFGSNLAKDIQAKLKESDKNYAPIVTKIKTTAVRANKKSPLEKLAEAMALMKGISVESAMAELREGKK